MSTEELLRQTGRTPTSTPTSTPTTTTTTEDPADTESDNTLLYAGIATVVVVTLAVLLAKK